MTRSHYNIVETFATLQGEGLWTGRRAVFVRAAGCNLWDGIPEHRDRGKGACAMWCDTNFAKGNPMPAEEILAAAEVAWGGHAGGQKMVVLSGGEPTLQVDADLVQAFKSNGWYTAMETNGTREAPVLDYVDHVCVSPKRNTIVEVKRGAELKVVLPGGINGEGWSHDQLRALERGGKWGALYIQPQDAIDPAFVEVSHLHHNLNTPSAATQYDANVKACLDFIHANPAWRLSLQTHKTVDIR